MILNRQGEPTALQRLDEQALFSMGYTLTEK